MKMKVVLMLLAIGLLASSAQAVVITVASGHASANTLAPGGGIAKSYDGTGLSGNLHNVWDDVGWGAYEAWLTYRNPTLDPVTHADDTTAATGWAWAEYDLGADYYVDTMEIWNLTGDAYGFYFADGGFKDVTIQYSTDDATWTTLGNNTLAKGPVDYPGTYLPGDTIAFGGATARYVLITAVGGTYTPGDDQTSPDYDPGDAIQGPTNPGYTGLAEVRFSGTLVPEPMTLGVLVLGAGSLALLRRRRSA